MSIVEKEPVPVKAMACALRPMEPRDVPVAAEIEQEAFPTLWPPTSFRRELNNRLARYLVAWEPPDEEAPAPAPAPAAAPQRPWMRRLLDAWRGGPQEPAEPPPRVLGFVGIWFMVDEAHITAIATRTSHRGRGIGELLLIGTIELALVRGARTVTLEVRESNEVAQSLYRKYGFDDSGVRKRYYTDNNENALIMTTTPIASPQYQALFQRLVKAHQERWGHARRVLAGPAPQ